VVLIKDNIKVFGRDKYRLMPKPKGLLTNRSNSVTKKSRNTGKHIPYLFN